jgi:hypothetical protein
MVTTVEGGAGRVVGLGADSAVLLSDDAVLSADEESGKGHTGPRENGP